MQRLFRYNGCLVIPKVATRQPIRFVLTPAVSYSVIDINMKTATFIIFAIVILGCVNSLTMRYYDEVTCKKTKIAEIKFEKEKCYPFDHGTLITPCNEYQECVKKAADIGAAAGCETTGNSTAVASKRSIKVDKSGLTGNLAKYLVYSSGDCSGATVGAFEMNLKLKTCTKISVKSPCAFATGDATTVTSTLMNLVF